MSYARLGQHPTSLRLDVGTVPLDFQGFPLLKLDFELQGACTLGFQLVSKLLNPAARRFECLVGLVSGDSHRAEFLPKLVPVLQQGNLFFGQPVALFSKCIAFAAKGFVV